MARIMKFLGLKSNRYLIVCLLGLFVALRSAADTVKIASGEYPPWTSEDLPGGGYLNLLISEAFKLQGIQVEFEYMPWKRALEATRVGNYHASSFWGENKERERDFFHSQSIENIYFVFFYNKNSVDAPIKWQQLSDLAQYRIGATRGYTYNEEFWQLYHLNKLRVSVGNDDIESLQKLVEGKIDLFPISQFTGKYLLHRNFNASQIQSIGFDDKPLSEGKNFILFSKVNPENKRYVKALNEGLDLLKKKGKLKQLREEIFK